MYLNYLSKKMGALQYIIRDTIQRLTFYFDFSNDVSNFKKFLNKIKKIIKENCIDFEEHFDSETCGDKYEVMKEIILRYEILQIFLPIDYDNNYVKIRILTQISMGKTTEDFYETLERSIKSSKKKTLNR